MIPGPRRTASSKQPTDLPAAATAAARESIAAVAFSTDLGSAFAPPLPLAPPAVVFKVLRKSSRALRLICEGMVSRSSDGTPAAAPAGGAASFGAHSVTIGAAPPTARSVEAFFSNIAAR